MPKAEPPLPKRIAVFVKFQLADKSAFAPFTGQDFSAWCAFLYATELYGRGDYSGQAHALDMMRAAVRAAQQKDDVLAIFKKSIPGVLDWGHEAQLWLKIAPSGTRVKTINGLNGIIEGPIWPCEDGPRICAHIHSKPSKKHAGYLVCKDCGTTWRSAPNGDEAHP
jgi:hypothetical protein